MRKSTFSARRSITPLFVTPAHRSAPAPRPSRSRSAHAPTYFFTLRSRSGSDPAPLRSAPAPIPLRSRYAPAPLRSRSFNFQTRYAPAPLRTGACLGVAPSKTSLPQSPRKIYVKDKMDYFASFATNVPQKSERHKWRIETKKILLAPLAALFYYIYIPTLKIVATPILRRLVEYT